MARGVSREDKLKGMVRQDCGSCHGMTLKGGLGKPLLPETLASLEAPAIAAVILEGIPGTPMPPWRGILSEEDALWIATKLKEGFPQ
ncbi:MAG: c-type cytochrome [Rhodomicrobium sp.]